MDYADEPYRRMYSRRTVTNKLLGWEGRAVMHEMGIYELDRAGVFEFPGDDPADSVAVATGLPIKVVRVGLDRLFKTKTWVLQGSAIIWPNYLEAQSCPHSDRIRQQESRKRRREDKLNPEKTGAMSQNVTNGHEMSQPSRFVTHSLAQPSLAQPSSAELSPERGRGRGRPKKPLAAGADTRPATWTNYPPGWRWSSETEAAAAMEGVSVAELQEHVTYWTTHVFSVEVRDLDGELQRSIPAIRTRAETARAKAAHGVRSTNGTRSPDDRLRDLADRREMHLRDEAAAEQAANGAHP